MDKLIFLFRRKDGLTREEFFDHYLSVHAALGMRLTKTMDHYVVNLTDVGDPPPDGVDAITEIWTKSAEDFMDPAKSFDTAEAAAELMADHNSFIGPYDVYRVEEQVVKSATDRGPSGTRSPGVQRFVALGEGAQLSLPGDATLLEHVENRVIAVLSPGAPAVANFVATRTEAEVAAPSSALATYRAGQYVQK